MTDIQALKLAFLDDQRGLPRCSEFREIKSVTCMDGEKKLCAVVCWYDCRGGDIRAMQFSYNPESGWMYEGEA